MSTPKRSIHCIDPQSPLLDLKISHVCLFVSEEAGIGFDIVGGAGKQVFPYNRVSSIELIELTLLKE